MLFSLTGASGAGKSTALAHLQDVDWGVPVRCVEFDSIGVPGDADTAWRHGAVEHWVRQALAAEADGAHMLLCGQVPMGEFLAAPSADRLTQLSQAGTRPRRKAPSSEIRPAPVSASASAAAPSTATNS